MDLRHKISLLDEIRDAVLIHIEDPAQISAERLKKIVNQKHLQLRTELVSDSVIRNREIVR